MIFARYLLFTSAMLVTVHKTLMICPTHGSLLSDNMHDSYTMKMQVLAIVDSDVYECLVAVPRHAIAPAEGRARRAAAAQPEGLGSGQEADTPHPSPHFHTCTRAFLKENSHEK
jgi:hypothetical protein